jgi:regulator of sigma E protease
MILAWIILSGLLHFEGERSYPSTTVGYMVQGGISEAAGIQLGDQILSINNTPVQNWNDVREQYISHLGDRMVFRVKRGEEIREIIFNKDILSQETAEQLDLDPRLPAMVGDIKAESPASKAGLQRGDRILSIAGTPVDSWDEMTDIIRSNPDKPLKFEIMHNNEKLSTTITPAPVTGINAQGEEQVVGQIGVEIYYDKKSLALFPALTEGIDQTFFITGLNIKGLWWLVSGQKSAKDMLGGPIMITKMAGDMAKISFSSLMFLIANLSIMLAIINILPIPALDGGHITIVLIEEIRRKPLTTGTKLKIQQVGMAILFVLIAFVMYNDIIKLF